VARQALPETTNRLLCALDAKGNRHLLITLKPENESLEDARSRGVVVTTRELLVQGQSPDKYLDIECLEIIGYTILDLIGGEIAEELKDEMKQPSDIVRRVMAKWRRFWGQLPQQMLSKEAQVGLFAELWFLSTWLVPRFGPDVTMVWRGPWGGRNDFEWLDKSIEVKATTNSRGRIHRINGLEQLEKPTTGSLYLFSLVLREERGAPHSLPGIIVTCREQLAISSEAMSHLESGLAQAGYSPVHQEEYSKMLFRVVEEALFCVEQDFPKVTRESFAGSALQGVERVEYEINLNAFDHLIKARQPQEIPFL
jgi:hypothetical protein